jgi:nitroimidazol reductase NimA-like FMN-containing flavoprotein (pyridoxamine 5'-phosphate oxidase superfamily)
MEMNEMTVEECSAFLERASLGRLGCSSENQPYVVPVYFAGNSGYLYVFSTFGQKVKWMRANSKVCVQTDEIQSHSQWTSVIVNGEYEELPEPQYSAERKQATALLAKRYHWWLNSLSERQMRVGDKSIDPLFFRIRILSMSGLRATDEQESRG